MMDLSGWAWWAFTVAGKPATKGSVGVVFTEAGYVVKQSSKRLRAWSEDVAWSARAARVKLAPRGASVRVHAEIRLERPPATHRVSQWPRPVFPFDVDKVGRALLDALTGVAYVDDGQVVELLIRKEWAPAGNGASIEVSIGREREA